MKTIKIFACALAVVFCSCAKVIPETPGIVNKITFAATIEDATKAAIDGVKVKWEADDEIMCFDAEGNPFKAPFKLQSGAGESSGVFVYSGEDSPQGTPKYAVYPYSACTPGNKIDLNTTGNIYTGLTIPAVQDGTASGIIMFAEPQKEGETAIFKSLGCVIKMNIPEELKVKHLSAYIEATKDSKVQCFFGPAQITNGRRLAVSSSVGNGKTNECTIDFDGYASGDVYIVLAATDNSTNAKLNLRFGKDDYSVAEVSGNLNSPLSSGKLKDLGTVPNLSFNNRGDYYNWFNKGFNLKIGDKVYNKAKNSYMYVPASGNETDLKNAVKKDLALIDSGASITLTNTLYLDNNLVLLGSNAGEQPTINTASKAINARAKEILIKNIKFISANTNYVITNSETTLDINLFVEDCSVNAAGRFIYDQTIDHIFSTISVNNCIISFAGTNGMYSIVDKKTNEGLKSISFKNNVIYIATATSAPVIHLQKNNSGDSSYNFSSLELEFINNTVYNVCNSAILRFGSIKQAVVNNNAGECDLTKLPSDTKSSCLIGFKGMGGLNSETSSINNNYFFKSAGDGKKWQDVNSTYQSGFTRSGNKFTETSSPILSVDLEKGYLPIKDGISAGATYTTKLWNNWGE